jgi:putative hydrolase of the HAD superfamily
VSRNYPKAILFDLDDTIISFSGSSEACWQEVCDRFAACVPGMDLSPEQLFEAIQKYASWYWSDPTRHKRGRLDLRWARREVAAGGLKSLNIHDPEISNKIADAFSDRRENSITIFPGAIGTL